MVGFFLCVCYQPPKGLWRTGRKERVNMDTKVKRAIISLTDKAGVVEFAKALQGFGVEIISTGGTAKTLRQADVAITEISDYTGFPEIMDGRVKTLHPKVHGGILAIRENQGHIKTMEKLGIFPIDMVVVNLYQFEKKVSEPNITLEDAVESIDIGGPTLLRAAAKNFKYVTVICDPLDYEMVLKEMKEKEGCTTLKTRFYLAKKVFELTHKYDGAIWNYLNTRNL